MQAAVDEHETPSRPLPLVSGLGVGWITHLLLFQCSASVTLFPEAFW